MATTATKTKAPALASAQPQGQDVAVFSPPRLPFHPQIEEKFGVSRGEWKVLVEAIYPAAKTSDSIVMVLSYCRSRKLDPFKRPVHIVPMYSTVKKAMVETVWPGISELRTTASRTKDYAGIDAAEFGEFKTTTFKGTKKGYQNEPDKSYEAKVKYPEWCQITVYRTINGERCQFVGPKVYWLETYARVTRGVDVPNEMWAKRAIGQLEKCAEAAALRRAFPEEIGNDYTAEEMEGQVIHGEATDQFKAPAPPAGDAPAREAEIIPPTTAKAPPPTERDDDQDFMDGVIEGDPVKTPEPTTVAEFLDTIDLKLKAVTPDMAKADPDIVKRIWNDDIAPRLEGRFPPDVDAANDIRKRHEKRLGIK